MSYFAEIAGWTLWEQFRLEAAKWPTNGNVFSLAEYIAALALLLVVVVSSDFRFKYRLMLSSWNVRTISFLSALSIGLMILFSDVWYQNSLPVPKFLANLNNVKAFLGCIFLLVVFYVVYVGAVRRVKFSKGNAERLTRVTYRFVHEGEPARLQVIAEELHEAIPEILKLSARARNIGDDDTPRRSKDRAAGFAHDFVLLLGDERFCRLIVDRVPSFALSLFKEAQDKPLDKVPVFQFARNIGESFICNTESAFYQEDSGFYSGLVGYDRPVSRIIFGHYPLIEACTSQGASPLEMKGLVSSLSGKQADGYVRASLAFLEDYLKRTGGQPHPHSYALHRLLDKIEYLPGSVHELDDNPRYFETDAYKRLRAAVEFVDEGFKLLEEHAQRPASFRRRGRESFRTGIHDKFADLIFELIFQASYVSKPASTAWSIQYNTVWSDIFSYEKGISRKIVGIKVRRLLYEEIKSIDDFANFKNARILGFCLNVFGLSDVRSPHAIHRSFFPIQVLAIRWARKNYMKLRERSPKVADACLLGSITYDAERCALVKTYAGDTRKEPTRQYLELDRVERPATKKQAQRGAKSRSTSLRHTGT